MDCGGVVSSTLTESLSGDFILLSSFSEDLEFFSGVKVTLNVFSGTLTRLTVQALSWFLKMSLLVFLLLAGLKELLGVFTCRGDVRDDTLGDCGTLKAVLFSATLHF